MDSRHSKNEFLRELDILENDGLKTNPLRLEYEKKVKQLETMKSRMYKDGAAEDEIARLLHYERRRLGEIYKDAAPPLFREYILYATKKKYGDPLGPDYEALKLIKSDKEIIESATRPIKDLDARLTVKGFVQWYESVYEE